MGTWCGIWDMANQGNSEMLGDIRPNSGSQFASQPTAIHITCRLQSKCEATTCAHN